MRSFPLVGCWAEGGILERQQLCFSFLSQCGLLFTYYVVAVQVVLRFFSEGIVLYITTSVVSVEGDDTGSATIWSSYLGFIFLNISFLRRHKSTHNRILQGFSSKFIDLKGYSYVCRVTYGIWHFTLTRILNVLSHCIIYPFWINKGP